MVVVRKFSFWLPVLSILICLSDANDTKWVTNSALISVRFPTYLIHFGTFLILGLIVNYLVRIAKQK